MLIKTEYFGQGGSASTADWHILRERQSIDITGELEVSLGLTGALHVCRLAAARIRLWSSQRNHP